MTMRSSITLSLAVLGVAGGVIYFVMPRNAPQMTARTPGASAPSARVAVSVAKNGVTTAQFAQALEREIPNAKIRADGRDISPERIAEIESHVDAVLKDKGDPRVSERLKPTTEIGRRLARVAMSVRHGALLSDEEMKQLGAAYFSGFADAREQTLNEARSEIGSLSGSYFAQERLGVYAVISALPDSGPELKSLALTELTTAAPPARPSAEDTSGNPDATAQAMTFGPAQVLPVYVYRMYLDSVGDDANEALTGTLQVLEAQQDPGIRQLLATAYISQYPTMKPQLYEKLAQTQIKLPDLQPQAPETSPRVSIPPHILATQ